MSGAVMTEGTSADDTGGVDGEGGVRWLSHEEQIAWRAYLRASRELTVAFERDLQDVGISLPEYLSLIHISEPTRPY